jgi:hypothetical protein
MYLLSLERHSLGDPNRFLKSPPAALNIFLAVDHDADPQLHGPADEVCDVRISISADYDVDLR